MQRDYNYRHIKQKAAEKIASANNLTIKDLILRTWKTNNLQQMLAINQDPKVMEYFPSLHDLQITKSFTLRNIIIHSVQL